ncbi:hypothetical protein V1517DRAFT_330900 [Lipomyces orientalis]|uniref:Uncharacterized protein n=1 Tax=Lipomyces orientalis TaxID=1233043 RepID=A0ACC3TH14_9ASCO
MGSLLPQTLDFKSLLAQLTIKEKALLLSGGEMPRPGYYRTPAKIAHAMQVGELNEETLDDRVMAVLKLLDRFGCFQGPSIPHESSIDRHSLQQKELKSMALLGFA